MAIAIPLTASTAAFKPPPGLEPPPGLGFDNTMVPAKENPTVLKTSVTKTRLSSKATPFQPKFDGAATGCQLAHYPIPEDGNAAINLGGLTQKCEQNFVDYPARDGDNNLQQTLIQLKGALAKLEPDMPKGDVQQTLFQLKGALAAWDPGMSQSDEQDECSSQASTKSGSSKSSCSSKDGKSPSSKSSNSSKSSKSSKSNKSSKSSRSEDSFVADALDVTTVAAATPVTDIYAYQSEADPSLAMMWGAQSLPFPQPAWQGGWPSPVADSWTDQKPPVPVSISGSLKSDFRDHSYDLKKIDPSFILYVRKIYRLGLESGAWLQAYFSKYGIVDKVLVGNSRGRANSAACMGFVVMSTAADAQAILRAGAEHVINGVCITVRPYTGKASGEANQEAASAEMSFQ